MKSLALDIWIDLIKPILYLHATLKVYMVLQVNVRRLISIQPWLIFKQDNTDSKFEHLPIIWPHSTVYHTHVLRDHFYLVYTVLIIQNGLLFLFCCKHHSICSWNTHTDDFTCTCRQTFFIEQMSKLSKRTPVYTGYLSIESGGP